VNERIEKLVRQAEAAYIPRYDMWQMDSETVQKFAELIVRECMDVAKYHTPDTEECEYTWLIHDKIQEYFGVEE
jgi:ABC-type taurine transport system substrate-binding protein